MLEEPNVMSVIFFFCKKDCFCRAKFSHGIALNWELYALFELPYSKFVHRYFEHGSNIFGIYDTSEFFQIKTVTSLSVILLKIMSSYSGYTLLVLCLQKVVLLIKSFESKNL